MKEAAKDPQIKLFGRKILLPDTADSSDETNGGSSDCDRTSELSGGEKVEEKQLQPEEESQNPGMVSEPDQSSEMNLSDKNLKATSVDEDGASENQTTDGENGQQKTLKKPDKILPCPRCNSMETKFCYYNNYNVNQPRHFCKSCQRYWTAGGTMRNVPVGAGRRKNKNSSSHCHHITISDALQATGIDSPIGFHHPAFEPNGSVLSFGANSLLCVPDKRVSNGVTNGHYESDPGDTAACKNRGDDSMGSSIVAKNSTTDGRKISAPNINAFQSPLANIPTAPWAIPWNSAVALPAIYPIPIFPAAYWNCGLPNGWNVPWLSIPSPTANQNSSPNSPLGKHSRNGELLNLSCSKHEQQHTEPKSSENSIVIPKTLRIDDPKEAAKSSIWETLGIKYDSAAQGGLFKALQPKGNEKNLPTSPSPVLHANPAALSRSINFHEGA